MWLSGLGMVLETKRPPVGLLVKARVWVAGLVLGWGVQGAED